MTSMSYGPRFEAGEIKALCIGVGRKDGRSGAHVLPRRTAVVRGLFLGPKWFPYFKWLPYLQSALSARQRPEVFPHRKTCGSALEASPAWGERENAPLFPYSKNFCTRLTDTRAPPSIVGQSAVEPSIGERPTGDLRRRCVSEDVDANQI